MQVTRRFGGTCRIRINPENGGNMFLQNVGDFYRTTRQFYPEGSGDFEIIIFLMLWDASFVTQQRKFDLPYVELLQS
jgi:hypothetical protein